MSPTVATYRSHLTAHVRFIPLCFAFRYVFAAFRAVGYAPNTGKHSWVMSLESCKNGHVFLGVCTAAASMSTYLGGDQHSWGLIGTRALWHNRAKLRSDFGAYYCAHFQGAHLAVPLFVNCVL